MKLRITKIRYF